MPARSHVVAAAGYGRARQRGNRGGWAGHPCSWSPSRQRSARRPSGGVPPQRPAGDARERQRRARNRRAAGAGRLALYRRQGARRPAL